MNIAVKIDYKAFLSKRFQGLGFILNTDSPAYFNNEKNFLIDFRLFFFTFWISFRLYHL